MPPALAAVQRHFGTTPDVAGILLAVFTFPGLVLTPILGLLADRIGSKLVIVVSLVVFGMGGIAALFATRFEHIVLVRAVQGVGAAALGALNVALISNFFRGQERIRLLGYNHSVLSIGTTVLPLVSGQLAALEWRLPFVLPSVGLLVAVAVAIVVPLSTSAAERVSVAITVPRGTLALLLMVSTVTYAILFGPFLNYVQERVRELDPASPTLYQQIGVIVGLMSLVTTLGAAFVGRLSARFSLLMLLQLACVFYAAAMVLYLIMPSFWLLVIPTALFGFAQALNQPVVQALVAELSPPSRLATVLSLNRTAALVGQTIGPVLFGGIYRGTGLDGVFVVGAVLAMLTAGALGGKRSCRNSSNDASS